MQRRNNTPIPSRDVVSQPITPLREGIYAMDPAFSAPFEERQKYGVVPKMMLPDGIFLD